MRWIVFANWFLLAAAAVGQQTAAPGFEVASVKLHPPPRPGTFGFGPGNVIRISGNRVTLDRNTLTGLVMTAYHVKDFQVSGAPQWARDREALFDIAAKTEGEAATSLDLVRPMLQSLLAERFQLRLHREMKELPVYELVVDQKGPKLKESAGPAAHEPGTFAGRLSRYIVVDKSMEDLVGMIAGTVDRPVLERTGLTGHYDFTLEFTHAEPDSVARGAAEIDRSIFTALREQLRLRLVAAKDVVEVLVIDRAERPSAN